MSELTFKNGDLVGGRFEVHGILGKGGFGEVYLVYDREMPGMYALKTIRSEYLADAPSKKAFKKEVLLWVGLDEHPFIVAARWVDEFSGRLFVEMDHIAPDGWARVSLADYLARPHDSLDTDRVLAWAVEFCYGMEHANRHGIKCHRDIKPSNILINEDGTLKISDFGLARGAETVWRSRGARPLPNWEPGVSGLSVLQSRGNRLCGTPGYIPPEVVCGSEADVRSDIYSFGLVLWQMAAVSPVPPFHVPVRDDVDVYLREVFQQQMEGHVPVGGGLLQELIERCLAPEPLHRPDNFEQLRTELESLLRKRTGRAVEPPKVDEKNSDFWNNKGASCNALGRYEEAIACFNRALEIDSKSASVWNNKGNPLRALGRHEEALGCYCKALEINPQKGHIWSNKALALRSLGRNEEALASYSRALGIDPQNAGVWNNMGVLLTALGRHAEALRCCKKAVEIDPRLSAAWKNLGIAFRDMGQVEEAMACFTKALSIDPLDVDGWTKRGGTLSELGRVDDALASYSQALEIDPEDTYALDNLGVVLVTLGRPKDALLCFRKVFETNPRDATACSHIGGALGGLGKHEEALRWHSKALEIDPRNTDAWYNKGLTLRALGRPGEAAACFRTVVEIDPRATDAWIDKARVEELSGDRRSAVLSFRRFLELARNIPTERENVRNVQEVLAAWGEPL